MSTSQSNFLNLFVNSNNAKRVAIFLIIGYVTFKLWKSFQPKSCENTSKNAKTTNKSKGIPTTQTSVLITSAGSKQINGEYRWFLNSGSWCFFNEDDNKGYSLKGNVRINENDKRLFEKVKNKRSETNKYFTICDIEGSVIYYVAPQKYEEYIPNEASEWIAVDGNGLSPSLFVNLVNNTIEPNEEDRFGNANMPKINDVSVDKMEALKEEEEEEEGDGDISDLETNEQNGDGQGNGVEEEEEDEDSDVSDLET